MSNNMTYDLAKVLLIASKRYPEDKDIEEVVYSLRYEDIIIDCEECDKAFVNDNVLGPICPECYAKIEAQQRAEDDEKCERYDHERQLRKDGELV